MGKVFVYMLKCADNSLYCGWTDDPVKILKEHNTGTGGAKYTKSRRPVEMVYLEEVEDKRSALKREAEIKIFSRDEKVALLRRNKNLLKGKKLEDLEL